MPTDDEATRVTTRAARKRLGSIDVEPAPSPNPLTPKKTPAAKKGTDQLPAIAESDAKDAEPVTPAINGTPHVIRSRKSLSESVATPTNGTITSTPLAGLRRKPGEVPETGTPGRRVTRRTSTTETFEELHLPVRRVTRRTSTTSEDAAPTASPMVTARAKPRMSIATAPSDATLIEESEEPPVQNDRSDSPAENTRSRVRALSHSPYNSGTDSKNTSAQENEMHASLGKDLKVNLVDAFKDNVAVKAVKFDQETAGNEAEGDEASKTKFAKTPKTVKNLSYTNNTTIEVSKLMNSTSEIEMSMKGDSSTASVDLDKSLEQLAQAIQEKGLPVAEESIMSSVQSPKVGKKDVWPATPRPTGAPQLSISSSTPIVKATPAAASPKKATPTPGSLKKAVTPVVEEPEVAAAVEEAEKEVSPKKRNHNATFGGKSSPKKDAGDTANRSWSHSVRGSSDKKIDAFGAVPESPAKSVTAVPVKKTPQKEKRKSTLRVVSSDEEDDEKSNSFEDDQCEVAPDDYQSGDSMDTSERDEMEKNEVVDDGESLDSDDSVGARDADFDEYDRDSFLASDEEGEEDDLLDGSGDDLSLGGGAENSPKKKRSSRKLEASDEEKDSSNASSEVQKKSPKKGGRIMRNPVDDSSDEEEDDAGKQEELNENELEVVKRFQDTVSELAKKTRKSSTAQEEEAEASPEMKAKPVEGTLSPVKSPKKSLKAPEETDKNDQSINGEKSPKKAVTTAENDAKSPPKSASKPQKASKAQEEQDSDDGAASDDNDSDEGDEDNDDEHDDDDEDASGEETSDDDFDDMVEDSETIEDSDEEPQPKQKKKQQKTKGNDADAKPTNMFGIKEQRLHVLLQKCHEFVGTKKDELEEAKRLTKGAREAKRQERLKRKEEEAARKQAQEVEDGRTVIKKKKKRKQKKKNPDLVGDNDDTLVERELPLIVKKKMEVLEKRKQRNREKKLARKKRKAGTDTTQSNSSQAEATPKKKAATDVSTLSTKSDKKGLKKKDKTTNGLSQSLQNLPTHISVAALNIHHKLAAAKAEQQAQKVEKVQEKTVEKPVKEEAPKSVEKVVEAAPPKKSKPVEEPEAPKPVEKVAEFTTAAAPPKKKKRQILDIVEQTLKQDKQEQSSAKPPAPKKRLKILDESGAFSTAQFDVVPVTPEAKLLKKNSGFKEAPITPEPINFKVTSILAKPQPAPAKSKGGFKEAMRKKLVNIQDVDHQLPVPKWKVKPTASGEFVVTKTKRQAGDYVPLSTEGSTTQFAVATLESGLANGGGQKKRKFTNSAPAASSNAAQKFKENAILGTAKREPMKEKFRKMDKKKANASNRTGTSFNIF